MVWTSNNIPDLKGKIAVVTGANSGIGYETARALALKGVHVVMACRSEDRAEAAVTLIRGENPEASVVVMSLDLADLASVREFAKTFTSRYLSLDILCNVAGVMGPPQRFETADGFELQFGTNHLGHFALTGLLLDRIRGTHGARVVTVSSNAHRMGKVDFDNLNAERSYKRWGAYGLSKLSNLLFTYELQRRFEAFGGDVLAVASHPGYSSTNLQKYSRIFRFLNRFLAQSSKMGALPTLYGATSSDVSGGDYFGPDGFMGQRGYPKKVKSNDASHDTGVARRLWEVSEKLSGVCYGF